MNTPLKCLCFSSVAVAVLLMTSCSPSGRSTSATVTLTIVPGVGVGPIKFGMPMDDVKKVLGEPDRMSGKALECLSLGLAVLPRSGSPAVGAIMMGDTGGGRLVEAFKGSTKEGIEMKSTRQQIVSAYGQPETARELVGNVHDSQSWPWPSRRENRVVGGFEELNYDSGRTKYTLRDGRVVHITLRP